MRIQASRLTATGPSMENAYNTVLISLRKFGIWLEVVNCVFESKMAFKWSQLKLQNDPCTFQKL